MGFFSVLKNIIVRIFYLYIGIIFLVIGYKGLTVEPELFLEMGEPIKEIFFYGSLIFGIIFLLFGLKLTLGSIGILSLTDDGKKQKTNQDINVAFPDVSAKSDTKTENKRAKTENKEIGLSDKPEKITNGSVQHCKKCNSTDMKGSSHGYCLHCQHIMHEIMKQQRPPFMR
jgi:hypothetical protein